MNHIFFIQGNLIIDISTFYEEINRLLMSGEDWQLGESLDALDDVLYGGFGALLGQASAEFVWLEASKSRQALGLEATRAYYLQKTQQPERYQVAVFRERLQALEKGKGPTYFDMILEVFAAHENLVLQLQE